MRSCYKVESSYLGSGKIIKRSVAKHGAAAHVKEILEYFPNREALVIAETKLITPEVLADPLCMNLQPGGHGGGRWTVQQQSKNGYAGNAAMRRLEQDDLEWVASRSANLSAALRRAYSGETRNGKKAFGGRQEEMRKRALSPKANAKRIATQKLNQHQQGERNSQYGTRWICKDGVALKVARSDLNEYLSQGYHLGRK